MVTLPVLPRTRTLPLPHRVCVVETDPPFTVRTVQCPRIAESVRPFRGHFPSHHNELHPMPHLVHEQRLAVKIEQRVEPRVTGKRHRRRLSKSDNQQKINSERSRFSVRRRTCRDRRAGPPSRPYLAPCRTASMLRSNAGSVPPRIPNQRKSLVGTGTETALASISENGGSKTVTAMPDEKALVACGIRIFRSAGDPARSPRSGVRMVVWGAGLATNGTVRFAARHLSVSPGWAGGPTVPCLPQAGLPSRKRGACPRKGGWPRIWADPVGVLGAVAGDAARRSCEASVSAVTSGIEKGRRCRTVRPGNPDATCAAPVRTSAPAERQPGPTP